MTGKRSYYSSSSFKMAALFTILLGASALLLGSYLYDFSRQIFIQETEAAIDIEIEHILVSFENKSQDELLNYIKKRSEKYSNPVYYYQNRLDKRLAGNITKLPTTVTPISEGIIQFSLEVSGKPKKFGAKIHTFDDGSRLLIGRDINNIIQRYERLQFFSILILLFMMSVVLVSFLISMFVVSRINIIGQTAQNIMATGDLSERISIDSNWDDLSNLAQSLNAMLARIEELMIGIRDVSDNIAHDLRTPLARLRTQLESALKNPLTEEEIDNLLKETDELLGTFNALLRISQIEKGSQKFEFKQTSLKTILADVIELYDPLAEEKAITIKYKLIELPTIPTYGHLIFQMIANIIDNALKYSPKESTVLIELAVDDDYQLIRISDQGIGIKSEEHDKVFDRFYRSDKSRHTEGNGLGLSLVKAALALHKGEITFTDNNPGLVVEIRLKS